MVIDPVSLYPEDQSCWNIFACSQQVKRDKLTWDFTEVHQHRFSWAGDKTDWDRQGFEIFGYFVSQSLQLFPSINQPAFYVGLNILKSGNYTNLLRVHCLDSNQKVTVTPLTRCSLRRPPSVFYEGGLLTLPSGAYLQHLHLSDGSSSQGYITLAGQFKWSNEFDSILRATSQFSQL